MPCVLPSGPSIWVRMRGSLEIGKRSILDPDLAVVPGGIQAWRGREDNPTTALLVVEVSDTTLEYDRHRKASIYARANVPDYWIINLARGEVEVHRDPRAGVHPRFRFGYVHHYLLQASDFVTPSPCRRRVSPLPSCSRNPATADFAPLAVFRAYASLPAQFRLFSSSRLVAVRGQWMTRPLFRSHRREAGRHLTRLPHGSAALLAVVPGCHAPRRL